MKSQTMFLMFVFSLLIISTVEASSATQTTVVGGVNAFTDFTFKIKHFLEQKIDDMNRNTINISLGQIITAIPFVILAVAICKFFFAHTFLMIFLLILLFAIWFFAVPMLG